MTHENRASWLLLVSLGTSCLIGACGDDTDPGTPPIDASTSDSSVIDVDAGRPPQDSGAITPDADVPPPGDAGPVTGDRYWVGGSGSFSDSAHWAESSGGPGGATVPAPSERAVVDGASGEPTISIDADAELHTFVISSDAGAQTTLSFVAGVRLRCAADCLFETGRVEQARATLSVGRDLDTAAIDINFANEGNLTVELTGTGGWRYTSHPSIWNFVAAQDGQVTTMRPVGAANDIDVENQCFFGDETALLASDRSEADAGVRTILEIHGRDGPLDIVADGARLEIDAIEHELLSGTGLLQHDLDLTGLGTYDVTGSFAAPAGTGPTWRLTGPLNVPGARVVIEKTGFLDTDGHPITAGSMNVGGGADGTGELLVGSATVTVTGVVNLGGGDNKVGRIDLGTGMLSAAELIVRHVDSQLTGAEGSILEVTANFDNSIGATLDLSNVTTQGGGFP